MKTSYKVSLVVAVLLCGLVVAFYATQNEPSTVDPGQSGPGESARNGDASGENESPSRRPTLASRPPQTNAPDQRSTSTLDRARESDRATDAPSSPASDVNDDDGSLMSDLRRRVRQANTAADDGAGEETGNANDGALDGERPGEAAATADDPTDDVADTPSTSITIGAADREGDTGPGTGIVDPAEETEQDEEADDPDAPRRAERLAANRSAPTTATSAQTREAQTTAPETSDTDTEAETDSTGVTGSSNDDDSTAPRANAPERYTIQSGDNFSVLAERFYGNERRWVEIAQANPTIDPDGLRVGQEIRLPDPDDFEPLSSDEDDSAEARSDDDRAVPYTVQAGDTLSEIASQYYGTSARWRTIYEANRNRIGANPNRLRAGTTLLIPPAPNEAER
ncbi:MAG: LysM peptidoglycan-binding domain-containing protein [bacterium]